MCFLEKYPLRFNTKNLFLLKPEYSELLEINDKNLTEKVCFV